MVDGDTIRVRPLGPARGRSYGVDLIGIDAPEAARRGAAAECGAAEATSNMYRLAFTRPRDADADGLLDAVGGRGRAVTLRTDPASGRRRRPLAYVTPRGRRMLQLAQLRAGWARVKAVRGGRLSRLGRFRAASARARRASRGVFGSCGGRFHRRAAARAPTRNEDCGPIALAGGRRGRLVAIRGVSCPRARALAAELARRGHGLGGWSCAAAGAERTRLLACGRGGQVGDVRNWPAAFEVLASRPSASRPAPSASRPASSAAPTTPAPRATTGSAGAVEATSATLHGSVDPNGRATSWYFEFGTTTAFGSTTPVRSAGARRGGVAVSVELGGLSPGTTYHFRLVATACGGCAAGTARGARGSFTTTAVPTYSNPVFGRFPDPMVLDRDGAHREFFAYGTGNRFPILRSTDLVNWQALAQPALPSRPAWVVPTGDYHPWSPSVLQVEAPCPGEAAGPCFVMYYTGLSGTTTPPANCVAVATSTAPTGPFVDVGEGPLTDLPGSVDASGRPIGCGDDRGYGNIDPAPFVDDDGEVYLYVSTDFRCPVPAPPPGSRCPLAPTISVIPLTRDGLHAAGERQPLFGGTESWEQAPDVRKVEGPWLVKRSGPAGDPVYVLLFSGGDWQGAYGMGYATAGSPLGVFVKSPANPILTPTAGVLGPGGGSATIGPSGGSWVVYHGRRPGSAFRELRIDPLTWDASRRSVGISGPTSTPQASLP